MNRLFLIIATAIALTTSCTTLTPEQKAAREEQKTLEARRDSINHIIAVKSLAGMDFVLEADRLIFKRGRPAYVSSVTNFISSVNGRTTVQIAPFNSGGPNGVGGITVEGVASNIKTSQNKDGSFTQSMSVTGNGISAVISITVIEGTDRATAVVTPNFNSNRITLEGTLYPAAKSSVYKGRAF
ncbi:DUF4251 domain-containing protein [Barnesiella sp. WM24]|uniref:DUF4251 domain-containing protein n=1 Tax=Barnesiella sp. WM24 TaxID=2558278 RepID=UPI001071763A|nr:DUF4251 domain-containing protein [Barnesiella sp. WM24]MDE6115798.1 DUF4251 domain-containing protein [Muribaculum sp.]TFU95224.1 DUF4251 domain-containing protein [Barnesiella sp. WM24]